MPDDWTGRAYVRVFVSFPEDYPTVWDDLHLLGAWLHLLMAARGEAVPWPRNLDDADLTALVEAGAVEHSGNGYYRMSGARRLAEVTRQRGRAGGLARAASADRDSGKFASNGASKTPPAESPASTHEPPATTSDPTPANVTSNAGDPHQQPAFAPAIEREIEVVGEPSLRSGSPTTIRESESAPASAGAPGPIVDRDSDPTGPMTVQERVGAVRSHGPDDSDCEEPDLHALHHRWYAGVGWRCLLCERSDTRSFADRIAAAEDHGDRPF